MVGALLGRDGEIDRLHAALADARDGRGSALLIDGEPGIGKTSLGAAAVRAASGLRVLTACGSDLERDFPLGVARQLLERPTAGRDELFAGAAAPAAVALAGGAGGGPELRHALYWVVAHLADEQPLLLWADDVHWADAPSVQWLAHLAHRIADLPVVLLLAGRPGAEPTRPLLAEPAVGRVRPAPLSLDETAVLVGGAPARAQAAFEVTGGNPFLLSELTSAVSAAAGPDEIRSARPRSVADAVERRLAPAGVDAEALAAAMAVLDSDATLPRAAALARMDDERAARAAVALVRAGILEDAAPPRFRHPLLRETLYDAVPAASRALLHRAAARSIDDERRSALHLLETEPAGAAWVVDRLEAAAQRALTSGAPGSAARMLERAMAEPPAPERRGELLLQSGLAQFRAGSPAGAADTLREALATGPGAGARTVAARMLAAALASAGAAPEAYALLEDLASAASGAEREQLEASLALTALLDFRLRDRILSRPFAPDAVLSHEQAIVAITRSFVGLFGGPDDARSRGAAVAAAASAVDLEDPVLGVEAMGYAGMTLLGCDEFDALAALCDEGEHHARRLGNPRLHLVASCLRSRLLLRRGDAFGAEELIRLALGLVEPQDRNAFVFAEACAVFALVGRGHVDEAVTFGDASDVATNRLTSPFLVARLTALTAAGARGEAMTLARQLLELLGEPPLIWVPDIVPALAAGGDAAGAAALSEASLDRARRGGTATDVASCLRLVGLYADGGLEALQAAVDADPPAVDVRMSCLLDLGAALRRANRRREAREPLAAALDLASRGGFALIADHAEAELRAAGARPRNVVRTGPEALTVSERRVAELAGGGLTNTEIAQALFVSRKTVETHLAAVFRKLDVKRRSQLGDRLTATVR